MNKILLIEDNLEMRENTTEILELANYDVISCENGKQGVDLAKKELPDLIICDVMMPELDGYGVLYLLSKDPKTAVIPFIFLTAKSEKGDFRKGMQLGADDYLTKPYEEMDLLNAIESRLKKNEQLKKLQQVNDVDVFLDQINSIDGLKDIIKEKKVRRYKKKEVIFREGDLASAVYYISSGKVKLSKMNDDAKEYIIDLNKQGDFIGHLAVLEDGEYQETATVLEDVEVNIILKQEFQSLIFNNKSISTQFIKMLSKDIKEKETMLLNLAYNTVRKRVADALLTLEKRYKETQGENFSMAISRDDLASLVGTATESVIRTLSEFKNDGLIQIKSSMITILDSEKLSNLKY